MARRSREEKYPNTEVFQYYNRNPKNRLTSDCVIRAISTGLDIPYNQVVMEMAQMQCDTGYDDASPQLIDKYLKSRGWVKQKQPRKDDNTKYTGKEFCLELQNNIWYDDVNAQHKIIANIGGHHIVAIIKGKIHDTWNSSRGCIGNIWVKPPIF